MKKMLYRLAAFFCLLLVCASALATTSEDAPAWLQQAAAASAPAYAKDVPAVVLQDERQVSINPDGHIVRTTTFAIRILTHEGRALATALEAYETDTGKVRELHAWLIRPNGQVKRYGKDETFDIAADDNDVYNESRVKFSSAKDDADAGAVFGYQAVTEERALFPQDEWAFQEKLPGVNACLPVLASRYVLSLPTDWSASAVTFNHDKVEPTVNGSTYTWELHNLAPIEPDIASLKCAPWLRASPSATHRRKARRPRPSARATSPTGRTCRAGTRS